MTLSGSALRKQRYSKSYRDGMKVEYKGMSRDGMMVFHVTDKKHRYEVKTPDRGKTQIVRQLK